MGIVWCDACGGRAKWVGEDVVGGGAVVLWAAHAGADELLGTVVAGWRASWSVALPRRSRGTQGRLGFSAGGLGSWWSCQRRESEQELQVAGVALGADGDVDSGDSEKQLLPGFVWAYVGVGGVGILTHKLLAEGEVSLASGVRLGNIRVLFEKSRSTVRPQSPISCAHVT